jgi:hypothetical protein
VLGGGGLTNVFGCEFSGHFYGRGKKSEDIESSGDKFDVMTDYL